MSAAAVSAAGEPLDPHTASNRELVTTLWDGWAIRSVPGGIASARRWLATGMWHVQIALDEIEELVRLVFERDLAYVGNRIVANRGARIPPERH